MCDQRTIEVEAKGGRTYVLAADAENAMKLASFFSWYEQSSQIAAEWKEDWGCKRTYKVTLRDYINGGDVICKLLAGKQHKEASDKLLQQAEADCRANSSTSNTEKLNKLRVKIEKESKEFAMSEKDVFFLSILGLTLETAESSAGAVLQATKLLAHSKSALKYIDDKICAGLGQKFGTAVVTSVLVSIE